MPDIIIKSKKSSDYKIIPVTGAWGGVSPQGEIVFDLFVEKIEAPETVRLRLEPGRTPEEITREGEVHIRESLIGVVVRPDIAHSIGKWLIEKALEAGFVERVGGRA